MYILQDKEFVTNIENTRIILISITKCSRHPRTTLALSERAKAKKEERNINSKQQIGNDWPTANQGFSA